MGKSKFVAKTQFLYRILCLLIYDISYIEVYLALANTICFNKTQDTSLVSCQMGHKIVFTHTLVLLCLLIYDISCYRGYKGLFSAC